MPDAVNTIIEALKEVEEQPRKQIAEIVEALGDGVALSLLEESRLVQEHGGLDVRDGTRRRTWGGVFFNLAKAKLPKAERNRIFRVRPPHSNEPPSEPAGAAAKPKPASDKAPTAPSPVPREAPDRARPLPPAEDRSRRVVELPAASRPQFSSAGGSHAGNRRRIVEVEVLRHAGKPAVPEAPPRPVVEAPRNAVAVAAPRVPVEETRPLRRIVTVAPVRQEPPATPDNARDRVRALLKGLDAADQRQVLSDLLDDAGGPMKEPEPEQPPEEPAPAPVDREQVLSAVADALGLGAGDLARALYDDDAPGARAKARAALERWRKGQ